MTSISFCAKTTLIKGKDIVRAAAKQLKAEDPKKWTPSRIAAALGVSRELVSDWLRDGKRHYGDGLYKRAAEITGYTQNVLEQFASFAGIFELLSRNKDLTFSHHKEVASIKLIATDDDGKLVCCRLKSMALWAKLTPRQQAGRGKRIASGGEGIFSPATTAKYRKVGDNAERLSSMVAGITLIPMR